MSQYDHIRKLLASLGDEQASKELSGLATELELSSHWDLMRAVLDHMIAQNLRAGRNGLEEYGRVQGLQSVIDFFAWIKEYSVKQSEQEKEPEPAVRQPVQGGYGLA